MSYALISEENYNKKARSYRKKTTQCHSCYESCDATECTTDYDIRHSSFSPYLCIYKLLD